jgi:DNA-binding response OmpR family regulator
MPGMARPLILVVDDRADSRKLLALHLQHEGWAVQAAADGEQALALARKTPPNLVLLDVLMPGMDGFEVCRRLRALPATARVPVVMLTSLDETDDCVRGLEAGADDFVHKPYRPPELRARVRSLLRVKALFDQVERQRSELAAWSATLEQRVAEKLEEVQRLTRLRRFFSPSLAARLEALGEQAWASHRREVTVLFADLRGFTAFAERAEPARVIAMLAEFHAAMGRLIFAAGGTIERYTGDGVMVFFNDPDPQPQHSLLALRLGAAMQREAARLALGWQAEGGPDGLAVGVARGIATLGAVGFEQRLDYAAIGTVTNLAARLCAEAAAGEVLLCDAVRQAVGPAMPAQALPPLGLKGFAQPQAAWRLLTTSVAADASDASGGLPGGDSRP